MRFDDLFSTALLMVSRNWPRYKSVVMAIGIGTIGFIVIRTMGDSVEQKVSGNLELIGEVTVLKAHWETENINIIWESIM